MARRLDVKWTRKLRACEAEAYDRFVDEARGGCYAQARAWAPAALAGRSFAARWFVACRGERLVGAALVLRPRAGRLPLPVAIVERGPVVDDPAELPAVLDALRRTALRHGVVRLQVMPYWADADADEVERTLAQARFRCVHGFDAAHARTLRVDLRGKDASSLFAGKAGESLRRKLRQAEKAGATARRGDVRDLAALERLHGELMGAQGRGGKPRAFYDALGPVLGAGAAPGQRGAAFVCEHGGEVVSALYASRHGKLATFVIGAASRAEREFSKMVPAMVAAIRWAHAEGCEAFDMGGIPMEGDTDDKRRSIAQFKLDFAKTPVRLVREHARWL